MQRVHSPAFAVDANLTVLSDSRSPRTSPRPYETTLPTVALCSYSNTEMELPDIAESAPT